MSEVNITVERIEAVEPHPDAEHLEIAKVAGTQTLIVKGQFKVGDLCVYFPPDICLPSDVSEALGVQKYLKTAPYGDQRIPCRVAACRLRGVPSYGFIQPLSVLSKSVALGTNVIGVDVTEQFRGIKYEPPARVYHGVVWGGFVHEPANFHHYTDIQHYRKYRHLLEPGTPVRITEKIHGTCSRIGWLKVDGKWLFYAGSNKTARKRFEPEGKESIYWYPARLAGVLGLLTDLCNRGRGERTDDVILFGELFGPGVQDLDYGIPAGEVGWRCFDLSINGSYQDWSLLKSFCDRYNVPTVPLLYKGPFHPELVDQLTCGPTTVADKVKSRFKGREGIVITPLVEQQCCLGRLILKSVAADYLNRHGAKDEGEL